MSSTPRRGRRQIDDVEVVTTASLARQLCSLGLKSSTGSLRKDVERGLLSPLMPDRGGPGRGVHARWTPDAVERATRLARLRAEGADGRSIPMLLFLQDGWGWDHLVRPLVESAVETFDNAVTTGADRGDLDSAPRLASADLFLEAIAKGEVQRTGATLLPQVLELAQDLLVNAGQRGDPMTGWAEFVRISRQAEKRVSRSALSSGPLARLLPEVPRPDLDEARAFVQIVFGVAPWLGGDANDTHQPHRDSAEVQPLIDVLREEHQLRPAKDSRHQELALIFVIALWALQALGSPRD